MAGDTLACFIARTTRLGDWRTRARDWLRATTIRDCLASRCRRAMWPEHTYDLFQSTCLLIRIIIILLFPPRFLFIFLLTHPHHHAPPRLSSSYSYSDSGLAGLRSLGSKLQTAEGPATKPVNHTNASESLILVWFVRACCDSRVVFDRGLPDGNHRRGSEVTGRQTVACHTSANRVLIGGRRGVKRM